MRNGCSVVAWSNIYRESNNVEDTEASGKSPRNFGESEIQYPSETFQLVRERELRPYQAVLRSPEQSGSFKELERQLW
jgi:hypothetical protein